MGRSCPLHNAHPLGGKPKLKMLISDRNGVATCRSPYRWLRLTREYSEEGEDKTHAQVRLKIIVRLASTRGSNRRSHSAGSGFVLIVDIGSRSQKIAAREGSGIRIRCGGDGVSVGRCCTRGESDCFSTAGLRQREPRSLMDRNPASQVRHGEGALAVAAVSGADEVEQGLVF